MRETGFDRHRSAGPSIASATPMARAPRSAVARYGNGCFGNVHGVRATSAVDRRNVATGASERRPFNDGVSSLPQTRYRIATGRSVGTLWVSGFGEPAL